MKITEAGKLYLKDFYILNESRKDMEEYLDAILVFIETHFNKKLTELNTDYYRWNIWKNKKNSGEIQLEFFSKSEIKYLRKNKIDLWISVCDSRTTGDLSDTFAVKMSVNSHKLSKNLRETIGKEIVEYSTKVTLFERIIDFKMKSSEEDANLIITAVIDEMDRIETFIDGLIEKSNLEQ
jgi:hypothetical protein